MQAFKAGVGLLMMVLLFTVFLSPPGATVHAFNQANLVRVTDVTEVDGHLFYKRVAPVYDIHP